MQIKIKLGSFFRQQRISKELSLSKTAELTGLCIERISDIERNKVLVSEKEIEILSSLYGCSVNYNDYDTELVIFDKSAFMFRDNAETLNCFL